MSTNIGGFFRAAGQYDRAVASLRQSLQIDPDSPRTHFQLGITFLMMGKCDDALQEMEHATTRLANDRFTAYRGYVYAKCGRRADAQRILADLEARAQQEYVSSFGIALIRDGLGDKAAALAAFERAYDEHAIELAQALGYSRFDTLSGEPRFEAIMRTVRRPR